VTWHSSLVVMLVSMLVRVAMVRVVSSTWLLAPARLRLAVLCVCIAVLVRRAADWPLAVLTVPRPAVLFPLLLVVRPIPAALFH
jgi:hypothetical protein